TDMPTPVSSFTPTLTKTLARGNTLTPTITPHPSLTPLATLDPAQAEEQARLLWVEGPACRLPCWWGVSPGEADWREKLQYLTTFLPLESGWLNEVLQEGKHRPLLQYKLILGYPEESYIGAYFAVELDNRTVSMIEINPEATIPGLGVPEVLQRYGSPEEILMFPGGFDLANGGYSMKLLLFYPQQGILFYYYLTDAQVVDRRQTGCFGEQMPVTVYAWNVNSPYLIRDFFERSDYTNLVSIEEAMAIDEKTFYETYANPNNPVCITLSGEY
ncbi:MAG TPA: hypothetical protein VFF78_05330, partial [Anaerolineaceae bacterium]|nr:hypothetical protein [Anaerolineaceae bacterium]